MSDMTSEEHTPAENIAKAVGVILWLFAITAGYFWAHKPFTVDVLDGLSRSLSGIAAWLGITWLGAALGKRVAGRWLTGEEPMTRLTLSAGIGLGLLSLLMLALGLLGGLHRVVAWGLVLVLGLLLWPSSRSLLADLRMLQVPRPKNGFQRWLMIYGGLSLLLTFFLALAPPTGWDTLVYHLTGPRLFLEAGRIAHPFDLPYLGFPQLGEMQFTLGMLLAGEQVAPLLHFGYGLMAFGITVSLARRAFGQDAAWLAGALLLSVPSLLSLMTRAYVDATLLFYATATLYTLVRWRESQTDENPAESWLILSGLFCGFSGGVKYTAVVIPMALAVSIVWISRHKRVRVIVGRLLFVAAPAVLLVLPWTLENWFTTGNPVYPFFLSGGIYWDQWRRWWFGRPGTGLAATAPWRLLTAPIEAVILGTEGADLYDATIGPLLLPSLPLLIAVWQKLTRKARGVAGHLLLFFAVGYAFWLNGLARTALLLQSRLLSLTFGAVAVLGGAALEKLRDLRSPQLAVDWLARAVISLVLALLLMSGVTTFLQVNPLPVNLGLETRDEYLTRRLGWYYPTIEYLNNDLPEDSVVLFLWEPRSYHCTADCRPDALLDRWLHTIEHHGRDSRSIAAAWRAAGATHLLLHRTGYEKLVEDGFDPITEADQETLRKLLRNQTVKLKDFGGAYQVYALRDQG